MKKLFFGLTIFIILVIGSIYAVLFTSTGNSFVASLIESKVNEGQKDVSLKVNNFKLTTNTIAFKATIDDNSVIDIQGDLNIFAKSIDVDYNVNIKDLSKLQNITNQKLNGSFSTNGNIKGDSKLAKIKGSSSVASSETAYDINLVDFNPKSAVLNIKNAKIEELLYLVNQPIYANGILNIDAVIKDANINALDGAIKTSVSNGVLNLNAINPKIEQKSTTPIVFNFQTVTKLFSNVASSSVDFNSSIANLDIKKADFNIKETSLKSDYNLFVKSLVQLEPILNQKLNGSFSTDGNISFVNNNLNINGKSDIFKSKTSYDFLVENSKPKTVKVNISDAQISSLLNFVNQPLLAEGLLNIDANISNAQIGDLEGTVITKLKDGLVNNSVVNKTYNQKLKDKLTFQADINTKLNNFLASSLVDVDTSLATIDMKEAVYDIENLSFDSDYTLSVADLKKLYDVSQMKMRGNIQVEGNISQGKDKLAVDGKSELFGGNINFNLLNDDFNAKIDNVEIKDLTHMLYYPEIFTSKSNIDLAYNLANKKGTLSGDLLKGQFIKNEFSTIINTFAKFDLTKEIYEKVQIKSDIDNEIINTFVDMESSLTKITVPSSTLNTEKNTINALVQTKIEKYEFDTTITGNLSNPKVKVDTSSFVKDKIKNKVKEKLKDKLKDKIDGSLLDNLLNKAPKNEIKKPATDEEIAKAFREIFG